MSAVLNDQTMQLMGMGCVLKDNSGRINSMDFHRQANFAMLHAPRCSTILIALFLTGRLMC